MNPKRVTIELLSQQGELSRFEVLSNSELSLLELFENSGVRSPFGCRVGTCGTCVVRVLAGAELLVDSKQMENDTLTRVPGGERGFMRLACRASLREGAEGRLRLEKIEIK